MLAVVIRHVEIVRKDRKVHLASKLRWTRLESMRLQCGSSKQTGGTYPRRCTHRKRTSKSPNKTLEEVLFGGRRTSGMVNDDVASAWSSGNALPKQSRKSSDSGAPSSRVIAAVLSRRHVLVSG